MGIGALYLWTVGGRGRHRRAMQYRPIVICTRGGKFSVTGARTSLRGAPGLSPVDDRSPRLWSLQGIQFGRSPTGSNAIQVPAIDRDVHPWSAGAPLCNASRPPTAEGAGQHIPACGVVGTRTA